MNKIIRMGLVIIGSLLMTSASALADDATNDLHCLMVYMQVSGSSDAKLQTAGTIGTIYFLGKLDGRIPGLDLEGRIITEAPKLPLAAFQAEAARCGTELKTRGQAETAMGKDLQQRGVKMFQKSP